MLKTNIRFEKFTKALASLEVIYLKRLLEIVQILMQQFEDLSLHWN